MKMCFFNVLFFAVVLNFLRLHFCQDPNCPPDACPTNKPVKIVNGIVEMKVFYDNDPFSTPYKWNQWMIQRACLLYKDFPTKVKLTFIIGAGCTADQDGNLTCPDGNNTEDLMEACASAIVPDFQRFVCCNNDEGGSAESCSNDQGNYYNDVKACADSDKGKNILLANSKLREAVGIQTCKLPVFYLNNVEDRCSKLDTYDALKIYLCQKFQENNVTDNNCSL